MHFFASRHHPYDHVCVCCLIADGRFQYINIYISSLNSYSSTSFSFLLTLTFVCLTKKEE
jgi:hypothetical protein